MDGSLHRSVAAAAVATSLLCSLPALAQGPPAHELKRQAELVQKYDKDGDGKLSPTELRAARPTGPPRGSHRFPPVGSTRAPRIRSDASANALKHDAEMQAILERFDANGNGTLDLKEMAALRKARERGPVVPQDERRWPLPGTKDERVRPATEGKEQDAP